MNEHFHVRYMCNAAICFLSENTGKFLLRNLDALTNSIYCTSQYGALMNRFPVMMTTLETAKFYWIGNLELSTRYIRFIILYTVRKWWMTSLAKATIAYGNRLSSLFNLNPHQCYTAQWFRRTWEGQGFYNKKIPETLVIHLDVCVLYVSMFYSMSDFLPFCHTFFLSLCVIFCLSVSVYLLFFYFCFLSCICMFHIKNYHLTHLWYPRYYLKAVTSRKLFKSLLTSDHWNKLNLPL